MSSSPYLWHSLPLFSYHSKNVFHHFSFLLPTLPFFFPFLLLPFSLRQERLFSDLLLPFPSSLPHFTYLSFFAPSLLHFFIPPPSLAKGRKGDIESSLSLLYFSPLHLWIPMSSLPLSPISPLSLPLFPTPLSLSHEWRQGHSRLSIRRDLSPPMSFSCARDGRESFEDMQRK